jgi:hypothetical protein
MRRVTGGHSYQLHTQHALSRCMHSQLGPLFRGVLVTEPLTLDSGGRTAATPVAANVPESSGQCASVLQAFVWDLGFQDMPVDKIVDASMESGGRNKSSKSSDLLLATMDALSNRASGIGDRCASGGWHMAGCLLAASKASLSTGLRLAAYNCSLAMCRVKHEMLRQMPLDLLAFLPLWATWILRLPTVFFALAEGIRLIRVRRLWCYFSERQEDLSADVRWVAGCKFVFILFATAHWLGNILFWLAAEWHFRERPYETNWLSNWVEQETLQYDWKVAGPVQTYIVSSWMPQSWLVKQQPHTGTLDCELPCNQHRMVHRMLL